MEVKSCIYCHKTLYGANFSQEEAFFTRFLLSLTFQFPQIVGFKRRKLTVSLVLVKQERIKTLRTLLVGVRSKNITFAFLSTSL